MHGYAYAHGVGAWVWIGVDILSFSSLFLLILTSMHSVQVRSGQVRLS